MTVIKVEDLGKAYRVRHENRERYSTLRDLIAQKASGIIRPSKNKSASSVEEFWAVKNVSFEVKQGEVVGIIGRNGAGKSTLLKLLSRITEPTTGRIRMKGRLATLLEVGTGFHPELTGRENISLSGAICGMTKRDINRRFDEIVEFAEVEKFLDTPVKRYSSGMYLRLAFAVAAHLDPEILIVDEVLAVGDMQFQRKCIRKMEDVAGQGRTVLFVSHQLAAVQAMCSRVLMLDRGTLMMDGDVEGGIAAYMKMSASGEDRDQVCLRDRLDRSGSGVARFVSCEFLHEKAEVERRGNAFLIGEKIGLRLTIESQEPVSDILIGYSVVDMRGTTLFTSHHNDTLDCDELPQGASALESWIAPNNLLPGRYSLRCGLLIGGSASDAISDVIQFEVEPAVGPNGKMPDSRPGMMRFDYSWKLVTSSEPNANANHNHHAADAELPASQSRPSVLV